MSSADEVQPDVVAAFKGGTYRFMGLELLVQPGALVPRAETEILGREAVAAAEAHGSTPFVIDCCCGSGNLGLAVAAKVPGAKVWATDLTDGCVTLARKNVQHLKLADRMRVFQGDLFASIKAENVDGTVDVIVCNPPYISTGKLESDRKTLLDHEPREAFDGGPYGLSIHQKVIREAPALLKTGGHLLFEFGLGQERQMKALFDRAKAFRDLRFVNNASGAPRVAVAIKQ
ncbi:MAG: peptide chain release factor N(5)-glutamine methyltransferase [Archangiaceae bacterium]|nr:peptide chain release factor N(5)-glutamine methyltransferase [Archangiaceae bacterium]